MPKMISFRYFFPKNKCLQGFTLLEMLLVIALMGMLALSVTALVDNLDEQERFETTRSRLQQIKTAIIGDTSRTLNGEPMISGFVADMGRLPADIEELVELPSAGMEWKAQDITHSGVVVGQVYGGWRGPYLDVMPSSGASAVRTFRDGWGNPDNGAPDPDFGWNVSGVNALSVQSYGSDGPSGTGTDVYEVDYPFAGNLVEANDWQVDLSGVVPAFRITINGNVAATPGLKLYVYYMKDGVVSTTDEAFASTSFSAVSGVSSQVFEEEHDAISPSVLPMGRLAAIVVCTSNGRVFDGDCNAVTPAPPNPFYFTLLPRAFTPPINIQWNID